MYLCMPIRGKLINKIFKKINLFALSRNVLNRRAPSFKVDGSKKGIIFYPDWSNSNAYQKLLYYNLSNLYDIKIYGFNPNQFTKEHLEKYAKYAKVLHLHWINALFEINDDLSIINFLENVKYAKKIGYTIVWTVHNFISHESEDIQKEIQIRKKLSQIVDCILVHGKFAKDTIEQEYGVDSRKINIIPHGHYKGYYKNTISKSDARAKLNINESDYVFLFFGNVRSYKGLKELIESFILVNKKYANSSLIIAGRALDKDVATFVVDKSKEHHKIFPFLYFIPDDEVQIYFNASDIVVLPFKNILTSGSALLAISFYKPIIVPSKGLLPELVNKNTGYLFHTYKEMENIMFESILCNEKPNFISHTFDETIERLEWDLILSNSMFKHYLG